jgi:hypothetical protein
MFTGGRRRVHRIVEGSKGTLPWMDRGWGGQRATDVLVSFSNHISPGPSDAAFIRSVYVPPSVIVVADGMPIRSG